MSMKIIIYLKFLLTYITDAEIFLRRKELVEKVLRSMDTVNEWYTETLEDLKLKIWLYRVPQHEISFVIRPADHAEFFNAFSQIVGHNYNVDSIIN